MPKSTLDINEEDREISECEGGCEVFEVDKLHLKTHIDEILDEDIRKFDMTSLNALLLISHLEAKADTEDIENHRLSLAYEKLNKIPAIILEEVAPHVRILDISNNKFRHFDFLTEFKELTSLICDHNEITSNTVMPYMPKLELLWLNHCKIAELYPWARKLQQSCPNLKYLSIMGNAAAPSYLNGGNYYEYLQYRLFIISLFPNLVHLDDRSVTNDQRLEAERMYKRPLIERIVSKTPSTLPSYIRSVGGKVSGFFATTPTFLTPSVKSQRNCII